MSDLSHKLSLKEKFGYSMGDAAANFVWRCFFFLPIFYTDTFGLAATQTAILLLVVRLSDGITDIIMGSIADRTETKNGKFRPWVIWSAPVLALFFVLLFTTPDLGNTGKLIYAYVIYFGLTLAYTANNVPYGALMGVMTPSVTERVSLSGFRFIGAFGGGLVVMGLLPFLVKFFGDGSDNDAQGFQYTAMVFGVCVIILSYITYATTVERIKPPQKSSASLWAELKDLFTNLPVILIPILGVSVMMISLSSEDGLISKNVGIAVFVVSLVLAVVLRKWLISRPEEQLSHTQKDLVDLLTNSPWLVLVICGVLYAMFTGIRPTAAAYYFKYYLGKEELVSMYFVITMLASMIAAVVTGHLAKRFSKKALMAAGFILGALSNGAIYIVGRDQLELMMVMAFIGELFAGMLPVLFYSMLGDTADYSEWKNGRRATGLVYSAGTFINKTGNGFAGALVLMVLVWYGYDAAVEASIEGSLEGMRQLMSGIPAVIAIFGAASLLLYPLNHEKLVSIERELAERRKKAAQ